jgi:hypothetical protein
MYSATEVFTQENPRNAVVTCEAIQKYIYIYSAVLSTNTV